MTFTLTQRKEAYKRLPPETQDLIMSNETTELITNIIKEIGSTKEQSDLADSEILYTLYCLQSLDDAINNITKLSNKNTNDLAKLKSTVQDNILSKYKIDINEFIEINKSNTVSAPIISPANLPMVEPGEIAHTVPHVEERIITTPIPSVSTIPATPPPTKIRPEPQASLPDYRYPGGKDPYREPLV